MLTLACNNRVWSCVMVALKSVKIKKRNPLVVCFMGIDGSGKTTQARKLQLKLRENAIDVHYMHLFSTQTEIVNKATNNKAIARCLTKLDTLSNTTAGGIGEAMIRIPALIIESWVTTRMAKSRNSVTIYDRYFYDKIISVFCSYSKKLTFTLKKMIMVFAKLISKPDVIFAFQLKPETAIKRKKEHSLAEAKEISELYNSLQAFLLATPINAESNIDQIGKKIQGTVFRILTP